MLCNNLVNPFFIGISLTTIGSLHSFYCCENTGWLLRSSQALKPLSESCRARDISRCSLYDREAIKAVHNARSFMGNDCIQNVKIATITHTPILLVYTFATILHLRFSWFFSPSKFRFSVFFSVPAILFLTVIN